MNRGMYIQISITIRCVLDESHRFSHPTHQARNLYCTHTTPAEHIQSQGGSLVPMQAQNTTQSGNSFHPARSDSSVTAMETETLTDHQPVTTNASPVEKSKLISIKIIDKLLIMNFN